VNNLLAGLKDRLAANTECGDLSKAYRQRDSYGIERTRKHLALKTAGTTSRHFDIDWVYQQIRYNTARTFYP
jgi:hypothetical protein